MSTEKSTEIEEEIIIDDENTISDGNIVSPFSTKDIKVTHAPIVLYNLTSRLKDDAIDLNPDFQRNGDLWNRTKMSRLIESILLRLPLPVFYFDVTNPDKWIVVDGLQRLSTIKKFIVDKKLKLFNLEFLTDLNNKKYDDLDKSFKRVLEETQIVTYQIEAQTPKKVRYAIFNRINTGGLSLNAQEVRQALNQEGKGTIFLREIVETDVFKDIVGVDSKRMYDRELALRFIAFKLNKTEGFQFNNISDFLDEAMEKLDEIKDDQELLELKNDFLETLSFSEQILGQGHHFSRSIGITEKTKMLNRSLFDIITVCFSKINDKEAFLNNKEIFLKKFKDLLQNEKGEFSRSITEGTSSKWAIETRFRIMNELITEVLSDKNQ